MRHMRDRLQRWYGSQALSFFAGAFVTHHWLLPLVSARQSLLAVDLVLAAISTLLMVVVRRSADTLQTKWLVWRLIRDTGA